MKEEWYVRSADGSVYGPADRESLIVWAREGRIEPSGFVSCDRKSWQPAPSMSELGMEWVVETESGKFFGPFNRDVITRLSAAGSIPPGATLFRRHALSDDRDPPASEKVVEKIVEKRVEVPVEKVVEKVVEVPVERIVEKTVEVPVDRIVEVEKVVEKVIEKVIEKRVEVPVEKVVEKIVEVPVERIVEKVVEVPVDRIVEVEKVVEKIVEKRVEVPVEKIVERVVEIEMPPRHEQGVMTYGGPTVAAQQPAFGGIFKGADRARMEALEAAARRELAAAKRSGLRGMGAMFGRRKP